MTEKVERVLSAGGVVFRKNKKKGDIEVLLVQHSGHHGWGFPKGHVEEGETPAFTAHREVEEEAGVRGEILEKAGTTTYFYVMEGRKFFKTVVYFLMRFVENVEPTHAWEIENKEWLPINQVARRLTFDDDKKMWQQVAKRLRAIGKTS